jgi:hypothetical protein
MRAWRSGSCAHARVALRAAGVELGAADAAVLVGVEAFDGRRDACRRVHAAIGRVPAAWRLREASAGRSSSAAVRAGSSWGLRRSRQGRRAWSGNACRSSQLTRALEFSRSAACRFAQTRVQPEYQSLYRRVFLTSLSPRDF